MAHPAVAHAWAGSLALPFPPEGVGYHPASPTAIRRQGPMEAELRSIREVAEDTFELVLEPAGTLAFRAGQYCRVRLPELRYADRKASRKFSLVNAPHDERRVVIATRTGRTGYKRSLLELEPGAEVEIEKVKGKLVLPTKPPRPVVMVAGGIGVVPFVSMLRDLEHHGTLRDVTLLYFNRTTRSAAYLGELQAMAERHPGLRLLPVMTREPGWEGETERLSEALFDRILLDVAAHDYYVVGTPLMVEAAVDVLRASGVPKDQIQDEDFSGYEYRPA